MIPGGLRAVHHEPGHGRLLSGSQRPQQSNRASAPGLEIAREPGIPIRVIPSQGLDREAYDKLLIDELRTHEVELVCLAGFMRLLRDAQRPALKHGVKITGCKVHFVDEFPDSGPIVIQAAVPDRSRRPNRMPPKHYGISNRYPNPRTVTSHAGSSGFSSICSRSRRI